MKPRVEADPSRDAKVGSLTSQLQVESLRGTTVELLAGRKIKVKHTNTELASFQLFFSWFFFLKTGAQAEGAVEKMQNPRCCAASPLHGATQFPRAAICRDCFF